MKTYLFSQLPNKKAKPNLKQEKRFLIFCAAFLWIATSGLYSQDVLARDSTHTDQDADGKSLNGKSSELPWFVVSDRNDNQLYKEPNTKTKLRIIGFNQVLYVLRTSGDFIEVVPVKDTVPKPNQDLFSATGKPLNQARIDELKGWIPIDHVIRFLEAQRQGAKSDKIKQRRWLRKGFIAAIGGGEGGGLFLYRKPDEFITGIPVEATQYYFVYKQTAKSYLVGTSDKLSRDAESNLDGWVPKSTFTLWPNNMAYEPNWDLTSRQEFRDKQIGTYFFIDDSISNCKREYYKIPATPPKGIERVLLENDGKRMPAYSFRLFSLNYTDSDTKKIGNVADPTFEDANGVRQKLSNDVITTLKGKISDAQEVFKTVNMIFAIDGTNSFEPYWPSIAAGIREALTGMNERSQELGLSFNYGILVYRDGASNSTYYPFSGLTTDINRLSAFMSTQKASDPEGGDLEGLFVGLNTLFDLNKDDKFFSPSNANYLFVIGDAGNRVGTSANPIPAWDSKINTVVDNLSKYYFNVVGIHVNCPTSNPVPYLAFKDQIYEIAKSVTANRFPYDDINGIFVDANNEIKIDGKYKDAFGCSGIIYSPPGKKIEVSRVTNLIKTTLTKISADVWRKEAQNLYIKMYQEPVYRNKFKIEEFRRIVKAAMNQPGSTVVQFVETGYMKKQLKDPDNT
ncbi:MAG: hypothetical protein NTV01_06955, partial [Bacteroidia bacterium]|nr:hypothetical protein [Bacteroidia bacterium]